MVQELHVLRCFSCDTFQSHIVKKTNKWECKICGSKQSVKKVYGRGSGKDCRIHTQKLNALKGRKEEIENSAEQAGQINLPEQSTINEPSSFATPKNASNGTRNKWAEFVDDSEAAVYQNNLKRQETISFIHSETFKNKQQKRKTRDTFDNEDFGEYSKDFDSVDSNYSTFSNMGPSGYTKKIKCNEYHISESNILNENVCSGYHNKQVTFTSRNSNTQFKSNFKNQSDSKTNLKWGGNLESENETKTLEIPSVNNKNKQQSNTKVCLKWRKYLDEEEDEEENVISTRMPLVKDLTSDQLGSEIGLKREKYQKNNPQEAEEVSYFKDRKFFGTFLSKDCDAVSSSDFKEVVSCDFVPNAETVESITPHFSMMKESVNHSVLKNNSPMDNNVRNSFFFDYNREPTKASSDETLKYQFSKEDDNNIELSKGKGDLLKSETVPTLPVFEQNCELSDSDFQLDF